MENKKYSFKNDYSELAHERVLNALLAKGTKQFEGYGFDECSLRASELIKTLIKRSDADVHFISGGTQANLTVLSSILRPFEAVIAAESAHIAIHEAGAIEATGHKICTVKGDNGKICADEIKGIITAHEDEHMVKPRAVYISDSTELGTIYKKNELKALSLFCRNNDLYLYLDGARIGAALNSPSSDLSYADVAELVDVFYIGGTKNGALFGEAIVICNGALKNDFRYNLKQRGAMLAKGAVIGIQFEALFQDGLYDELAINANRSALMLAEGIRKAGYSFLYPAETNMIFPVFPTETAEMLHKFYNFYDWSKNGDMVSARMVTSWATQDGVIDEFLELLR